MVKAEKVIKGIIAPVLDPKSEKLFFHSLIDHLYLTRYDSDKADELIRALYVGLRENLTPGYLNEDAGCNLEEVIDYLDSLYLGEAIAGNGLDNIKHWTVPGLSDLHLERVKTTIENVVSTPNTSNKIVFKVNENVNILLDYYGRRIIHQYINLKNNNDFGVNTTVINAYPEELEINENVLDDMNRTFTIKWISHGNSKAFYTKESTIKEIEDYLRDGGYVVTPKHLGGCLAAAIQALINDGCASLNNSIKTPGFYLDLENKSYIEVVGYEYKKPTKEDLTLAVGLIDELVQYF